MNPANERLMATARALALDAAQEVLRLYRQPIHKERKEDRSLVTEADLLSDQILREGLQKNFPGHSILTEENGLTGPADAEYVWLIDPLDGTKAYAKGIPGFSVMVGLLKDGKPYLGVVVDPLEDFVYEAIRGQGATLCSKGKRSPLQVSTRSSFDQMPLVVSTGFPKATLSLIQRQLQGPLVTPINSVGIKVGLLLRQVADIYLNHHSVHLWDTCAPQVILEEAGGVFTRIDETSLHYDLTPPFSHESLTIASNGKCHQQLLQMISHERFFSGP